MVFVDYCLCKKCETNGCCINPKTVAEAKRVMGLALTIFISATVFLVLGFYIPNMLNNALMTGLQRATTLDSYDSVAFEMFADNSKYPLWLDVYMLNITNPHDVLQGAKPNLEEVGPFVYKQYRKAVNLSWSADSTEITWKYYMYHEFVPELSVMSDETNMTSLNMAFWGLAAMLNHPGDVTMGSPLHMIVEGSGLNEFQRVFNHRPMKEIIFGYDNDPILEQVSRLLIPVPTRFPGLVDNFTSIADTVDRAKFDTLKTGFPDYATLRQYAQYKDQRNLEVCPSLRCYPFNSTYPPPMPNNPWLDDSEAIVRGSDGGAFPTPLNQYSSPLLWAGSFYRAVNLQYEKTHDVKGIEAHRFRLPEEMWRKSEYVPHNKVFFQDEYNGVLNITAPLTNLKAFITRPRYGSGPDPVLDKIDERFTSQCDIKWGTDPVDTGTYFDVEPLSGASLNVMSTSQLVLTMYPMNVTYEEDWDEVTVEWFKGMRTTNTPYFWARQYVTIGDTDAATFRNNVHPVLRAIDIFPIVAFSLCGVLYFAALLVFIRGYRHYHNFRFDGHVFVETDNVPQNYDDETLASVDLDPSESFVRHGRGFNPTYGSSLPSDTPLPHPSAMVAASVPHPQQRGSAKPSEVATVAVMAPSDGDGTHCDEINTDRDRLNTRADSGYSVNKRQNI